MKHHEPGHPHHNHKVKLEKEKEEIVHILEGIGERIDHQSAYRPRVANFGDDTTEHEDEEADEAEEFGNRIGINQVLSERLQQIDAALGRMEKGSYGKCEKCGNSISEDVLQANPSSLLCKECKRTSA